MIFSMRLYVRKFRHLYFDDFLFNVCCGKDLKTLSEGSNGRWPLCRCRTSPANQPLRFVWNDWPHELLRCEDHLGSHQFALAGIWSSWLKQHSPQDAGRSELPKPPADTGQVEKEDHYCGSSKGCMWLDANWVFADFLNDFPRENSCLVLKASFC